MSDQNEFELTAKPDTLSLKVKGGAASRLAHQLADVLSPFSGLLGAAGDKLEQYRILRREAAAAALLRAKELKTINGIETTQVSQKIIAPWLEGASAEDIGSTNLLELWARILAAAPEEFDASYLRFIEVTKNIGPREAVFFQSFMENYKQTQLPEAFFDDTGLGTKSHNIAASENMNFIHKFSRAIFDDNGMLRDDSAVQNEIGNVNSQIVGQIVVLAVGDRGRSEADAGAEPVFRWFMWEHPSQVEIEILRQLGLVKIDDVKEVAHRRREGRRISESPVHLEVMQPTVLGCSFYFGVIANSID